MKAKITEYKGVHFRSRLEVKWCQFFESLGVRFEYESKLKKTSLGGYVPDFYFKSLKTWVEIKGTKPTPSEITKIKDVCKNTRKCGFIITGYPLVFPSGVEPHLANSCCYFINSNGASVAMSLDEIYQLIKDIRVLSELLRCETTGSSIQLNSDFMRCISLEPATAIFKPNKHNLIEQTRFLCKVFKVVNAKLDNNRSLTHSGN